MEATQCSIQPCLHAVRLRDVLAALLAPPASGEHTLRPAAVAQMLKPQIEATKDVSWGLGVGLERTRRPATHSGTGAATSRGTSVSWSRFPPPHWRGRIHQQWRRRKPAAEIVPAAIGGDHPAFRWKRSLVSKRRTIAPFQRENTVPARSRRSSRGRRQGGVIATGAECGLGAPRRWKSRPSGAGVSLARGTCNGTDVSARSFDAVHEAEWWKIHNNSDTAKHPNAHSRHTFNGVIKTSCPVALSLPSEVHPLAALGGWPTHRRRPSECAGSTCESGCTGFLVSNDSRKSARALMKVCS